MRPFFGNSPKKLRMFHTGICPFVHQSVHTSLQLNPTLTDLKDLIITDFLCFKQNSITANNIVNKKVTVNLYPFMVKLSEHITLPLISSLKMDLLVTMTHSRSSFAPTNTMFLDASVRNASL